MFRPALLSSYALNYALGGESIFGYRLLNLTLHVGCSVIVILLAHTLTGNQRIGLLAGLLFLVHPTHGEPINYISSRSDLLVSFAMLAVIALIAIPNRFEWSHWLWYVIGLLTKSVAVVTPALVLLFQTQPILHWKQMVRRYWGFGAITGLYLLVIWGNGFLGSSLSKAPRGLGAQLFTQVKAVVYYPYLLILPARLNVEHQFTVSTSLASEVVIAVLLLVTTVAIAVRCGNLVARCSLWFGICLLPASLMPLNILVSERRMYLASAGLLIAAAWCLGRLRHRLGGSTVTFIILFVFSLLVVQRNEVWASQAGLWSDSVAKAPNMHRARVNLGLAFLREDKLSQAVEQLEEGLRIASDYADGWVVLGEAYQKLGELEKAESAFGEALRLDPSLPGVHHNLGNLAFAQRNANAARAHFLRALEVDPLFVEARNNLGQAYEATGNWPAALSAYERAVADSVYWLNTGDPVGGAWLNLARAAEETGDGARAGEAYLQAWRLLRADGRYASYAELALQAAQRLGLKVGE